MGDGSYHACGFLFDPVSQRVLLHHRDHRAKSMPDCWSFFCGGPLDEDGGEPTATWVREMREEIGVALLAEDVVPLGAAADPRYAARRYVFVAEWHEPSTVFTITEGDGVGWFSLEEALALPDLPTIAKDDLTRFAHRYVKE